VSCCDDAHGHDDRTAEEIDRQLLENTYLAQSGKDGEQEEHDSNAAHPQVDGP